MRRATRATAVKFSAPATETGIVTYSYQHPEEGLQVSTVPAAK
ncbi:MAG TPA: hypothetical protein VN176_01200 [Verrucomicrobiae bacterium]|nr:hypothetical protein [Verrucomicrobiae bacterium]